MMKDTLQTPLLSRLWECHIEYHMEMHFQLCRCYQSCHFAYMANDLESSHIARLPCDTSQALSEPRQLSAILQPFQLA